jgi:hypothetical protein
MPAIDVIGPQGRRTLLDVLAWMAASEGSVADEEHGAFRGACIALGEPERGIDEAARLPSALPMSSREVMLTYCAAAWMALADGVQLRAESLALERLRRHLRLDFETARVLASHARWVRASVELPWHRELDVLLVEAVQRIEQLERHARIGGPTALLH